MAQVGRCRKYQEAMTAAPQPSWTKDDANVFHELARARRPGRRGKLSCFGERNQPSSPSPLCLPGVAGLLRPTRRRQGSGVSALVPDRQDSTKLTEIWGGWGASCVLEGKAVRYLGQEQEKRHFERSSAGFVGAVLARPGGRERSLSVCVYN